MGSVVVVVADILSHQALQVSFIEHEDMIKQVSSTTTNEALCHSVPPRTAEAGSLGFDAKGSDRVDRLFAKGCRPIEDQVLRCVIEGECLSQLLRHPRAGRIPGAVKKSIATNDFTMIIKECYPSLRWLWRLWCIPHPAQNGPLGDFKAEHLEFA
jgi:hypothetical protein